MSQAFAAVGSALALERDWTAAEAAFRQTMKLGFHAGSARQYAMLLTLLGRFDEAWPHLQKAQQVDPFSYLQKAALAKFLYMSRRPEEAIGLFSDPLKFGPLPLEAQLYLALIHTQLGQFDEARRLAQFVLRNAGAQLPMRGWVAQILARCGDDVAPMVDAAGLQSPTAQLSHYRRALLSIAMGDSEAALSSLTASFAHKEPELPWLAVDPRFDPIRPKAQFVELAGKVRSGIAS
jgi:tetratricopeptide (TPR) repeat protein